MKYKFSMPIGDWSDDGHGKCDYYTIVSNKSVEEVREIHFKIADVTGIELDRICSEYEQNYIYVDLLEDLKELGFDASGINVSKDKAYIYSYNMMRIWMFLLMKTDESLKLEVEEESLEMLPFYGFDEKGRHINFVGYGCFY
ncbi:hypothetical protein CHH83_01955 [Bacillus sp. 7586-K]|nr:hypothetical protein CHH83_01955 [Bacillus sp. 7586-K]